MNYIFYWYENLQDWQKNLLAVLALTGGCLVLAYFKDKGSI